jgi:uncharacterized protein YuzE
MVAVGRHGNRLVIVPYEQEHETVTPVTMHATTRQQINVRLRTGRFIITMNKPKLFYFEKEDILHLVIAEEEEANSVELSPNITAELNEKGELTGIEILHASMFVRDVLLEGVQARLLNLTSPEK